MSVESSRLRSKETYLRIKDTVEFKEKRAKYQRERYLANKERILKQSHDYNNTVVSPYRSLVGDIPKNCVVHHLNLNHDDNELSNLLVMSRSDHNRYHNFLRYNKLEEAKQVLDTYQEVHNG